LFKPTQREYYSVDFAMHSAHKTIPVQNYALVLTVHVLVKRDYSSRK